MPMSEKSSELSRRDAARNQVICDSSLAVMTAMTNLSRGIEERSGLDRDDIAICMLIGTLEAACAGFLTVCTSPDPAKFARLVHQILPIAIAEVKSASATREGLAGHESGPNPLH